MSSKIYFSDKSGKSIQWYIVNTVVKLLYLLAPKFTETRVRNILLKPHNRAAKPIPEHIHKSIVPTSYGDLAVYTTGAQDKPTILFTHGWSGASSQFYELMQSTAAQGYHCIAFDHYAHHHSTGKECNFPLFVIGLNNIIDTLQLADKLHCVVSHSMGVAGTVNVFHGKSIPHFFIAPFFDFWHELSTRITGAGIPEKVFNKVIYSIETDYQIKIKDLEPDLHMEKIQSPIYIVHDPEDKFALYKFSQAYQKQLSNITLNSIENTGHMRIINSEETQAALINFVNLH